MEKVELMTNLIFTNTMVFIIFHGDVIMLCLKIYLDLINVRDQLFIKRMWTKISIIRIVPLQQIVMDLVLAVAAATSDRSVIASKRQADLLELLFCYTHD